ncbi:DUF5058 family protein [Dialister sp.]|uniref:DUF5058 family protein n=1 Tax=Dialister sp. TaxID=1955814 RepID=UPI002E7FB86A|nr:DUF5058 family protein [Dialister sp.]MEE3453527.1 DUF5058 family protein [Dialister sp.]
MELKEVVNSPGMWLASSVMIIVVLVQSIIYLRSALKEAKRLNISSDKWKAGMRSAMITAIGPSMSPVIILLALIAVLGAPTAWMRMNDIGAARTELAMVTQATAIIGMDPQSSNFNELGFSYALWGSALNNFGWMFFTFILTPKMGSYVEKLNTKYDVNWIKMLTAGATIGLFAFLLTPRLVSLQPGNWVAACSSAAVMVFISKVFAKQQRLQELALGIAMLVGMYLTSAIFG